MEVESAQGSLGCKSRGDVELLRVKDVADVQVVQAQALVLELSAIGCEQVGDVVGHKLLPFLGEVGLATAHLDRQFL